ncbi:MAG: hypothetical protein HQL27_03250 [Candidatus Omnitrophica bacterium]|nr:hypothetical protein [Candidatus Omnitrophota bacterium]
MEYICPICNNMSHDLSSYLDHGDTHVVDLIKNEHPGWKEKNGLCPKCLDYYRSEIKGGHLKDAASTLRHQKDKIIWQFISGKRIIIWIAIALLVITAILYFQSVK